MVADGGEPRPPGKNVPGGERRRMGADGGERDFPEFFFDGKMVRDLAEFSTWWGKKLFFSELLFFDIISFNSDVKTNLFFFIQISHAAENTLHYFFIFFWPRGVIFEPFC